MASTFGTDRDRRNEAQVTRAEEETVLVGRVLRPHGLRGEVKIDVLSDVPERFEKGSKLWLLAEKERRRERVQVADFRPLQGKNALTPRTSGRGILRLKGYQYRDQAESIRGHALEVDLAEVPEAPPDHYYHHELIGCRCADARSGDLGEVVAVVEDGGGVLLEIQGRGDRFLLVPFVEAFLIEVDTAARRIDLNLPPGLVETCVSRS